jgi:uncharacterized protein
MKKYFTFPNIALAAVLAYFMFLNGFPLGGVRIAQAVPYYPAMQAASQPQTDCTSSRTVQVTGAALINITPDRVSIQLGVESNGVSVRDVEAINSASIRAVIRGIKDQGVSEKDITTDVYIIEPIYESYDSLYIKGYRINNMVEVTLKDVAKTSAVIAAALDAGANQVLDVEFYTSELRKYRDQARELAMTAAKEKAQALATAGGADVSCLLNISENSRSYYNGWWWYGWYRYNNNNQNLWTQNTVQTVTTESGEGNSGGDEPISLGQISIKAEVSATFSLK